MGGCLPTSGRNGWNVPAMKCHLGIVMLIYERMLTLIILKDLVTMRFPKIKKRG